MLSRTQHIILRCLKCVRGRCCDWDQQAVQSVGVYFRFLKNFLGHRRTFKRETLGKSTKFTLNAAGRTFTICEFNYAIGYLSTGLLRRSRQ